jgi:hypothetical protein
MKRLVIAAGLLCAATNALAQDPRRGYRIGEDECPQGREIRATGKFPAMMTDCQVLDADTASRNRKLRQQAQPKPTQPAPVAAPKPPPAPLETPRTETAIKPAAPQQQPARAEAAPGPTDYEDRMIGRWMVSAKRDRFGDGGSFVAVAFDQGIALAVRCIQKKLTIAMIEAGPDQKPLQTGEAFKLKFRVDLEPVLETAGVAIDNRVIQVVTDKSTVKAMQEGREAAVRIENAQGVSRTSIFKTSGARAAFADLAKECPLD